MKEGPARRSSTIATGAITGGSRSRGIDDGNLKDPMMPTVPLDQVAPGAELGKSGGRVGLDGEEGREPVLGWVGEGWVRIAGGVGRHQFSLLFY